MVNSAVRSIFTRFCHRSRFAFSRFLFSHAPCSLHVPPSKGIHPKGGWLTQKFPFWLRARFTTRVHNRKHKLAVTRDKILTYCCLAASRCTNTPNLQQFVSVNTLCFSSFQTHGVQICLAGTPLVGFLATQSSRQNKTRTSLSALSRLGQRTADATIQLLYQSFHPRLRCGTRAAAGPELPPASMTSVRKMIIWKFLPS